MEMKFEASGFEILLLPQKVIMLNAFICIVLNS